jgi:hypothetical protein
LEPGLVYDGGSNFDTITREHHDMPSIHPIQPILVAVLAGILWYMKRKPADRSASGSRGKKPAAPTPTQSPAQKAAKAKEKAEQAYLKLRQQALQTKREGLGLPPPQGDDEIYGLLMEMEIADSVVTLVCFANGEASLCYQSGGGMVGEPSHEEVHRAAKEWVALGQRALPRMVPSTSQPLPGPDKIRFYALTSNAILATETDRAAIGQPGNDLSALFYSGQEVVSQMREAQARQTANQAAPAAR